MKCFVALYPQAKWTTDASPNSLLFTKRNQRYLRYLICPSKPNRFTQTSKPASRFSQLLAFFVPVTEFFFLWKYILCLAPSVRAVHVRKTWKASSPCGLSAVTVQDGTGVSCSDVTTWGHASWGRPSSAQLPGHPLPPHSRFGHVASLKLAHSPDTLTNEGHLRERFFFRVWVCSFFPFFLSSALQESLKVEMYRTLRVSRPMGFKRDQCSELVDVNNDPSWSEAPGWVLTHPSLHPSFLSLIYPSENPFSHPFFYHYTSITMSVHSFIVYLSFNLLQHARKHYMF